MIYPVNNLDDAYNVCNPEQPLEVGDPRYLDLTAVRSPHNISILTKRIVRAQKEQTFHKQLFSGHRGSGKSTELLQLKGDLEHQRYAVVFLDVEKLLDLAEITYQDVLLIIATGVVETLDNLRIRLDDELLADLKTWFAERVVTQVYAKEEKATIQAKLQAIALIPFVKLMAELRGEVSSASGRREEIRQTLEKELRVFIAKLNDLLLAARLKLQQQGYVDLVIIVDGLEKMHYRQLLDNETSYSNLFIRHSEQLNSPESHIIYTVPISLAFNSNLGNEFSAGLFMMPMVKYQKPEGKAKLIELINQRMMPSLFANTGIDTEELQKKLIAVSGGSMRDLFRLIRFATETANGQITAADVKTAIQTLAKEYDRLVRNDFISLLKEVADKKIVPTDSDKIYEQLLNLRLVHEYENGERWADIHPVLHQISRLQSLLPTT
jgi:energy-coupling factor transporter ATP-binding protein EcfA2